MHVAYLVNQYPQISHTFIRNEIQELEKQGVSVSRFAIRGWDAELKDEADSAEREATTYLLGKGLYPLVRSAAILLASAPLRFSRAFAKAVRAGRASDRGFALHAAYFLEACYLTRHLQKRGIKHLHCHFGTNPALIGMLCSTLGDCSFSFTVHGPEEFDISRQISLAEKARSAAFIIAISDFGRSQLYRFLHFADWHKISIVHCGLGPDFLESKTTPPPLAPELVSIGRLSEQKGQMILVRACRILRDRGVAFKMTIVGDGELRPVIESEIEQSGLQEQVYLAGWRSGAEIRDILSNSRALVLPSFAEGLPVVIMEAMALARPVISTFIAGIPELVRDGKEGYLVSASNVEQLADAMALLLSADTSELKRLGESARIRVGERHSIAIEAGKLASLFRAHE